MSANNLLGLTTDCGWEVFEKISTKQHSGGNFCVRYLVRKEGNVAFLKAMDLSRAFQQPDRIKAINTLTSHYLFETEILEVCKGHNMTRVVVPFSSGKIKLQNQMPPLDEVYFIVFEKAESDLRQAFLNTDPTTWISFFRAIKHTCIGLEQLHQANIAHQDIKPSNILNFENDVSKVADLGRVVDKNGKSPFSSMHFAGDPNYAPIEMHLNVSVTNFEERFLADLSAVGSLIYQTFMGVQLTGSLISESIRISPAIRRMNYFQALPVFETAFYTLMDRLYQECLSRLNENIATAVVAAVSEMCHPDFRKRGAPKTNSTAVRANLRRYTSKIDSIIRQLKITGIL